MYIAYSALQQKTITETISDADDVATEPLLRYEAYEAACEKLSNEIAAIQKYMPGWMPVLR